MHTRAAGNAHVSAHGRRCTRVRTKQVITHTLGQASAWCRRATGNLLHDLQLDLLSEANDHVVIAMGATFVEKQLSPMTADEVWTQYEATPRDAVRSNREDPLHIQ